MNFRERLYRFMSGRYGTDALFFCLFGVAAALAIINSFVRSLWIQIPVYLIIGFACFRFLSRDIPARRAENMKFRELVDKIYHDRQVRASRKADRTHVYKKCPNCGVILRLPRRKGKHTTVCPHCEHSFRVYVFKK